MTSAKARGMSHPTDRGAVSVNAVSEDGGRAAGACLTGQCPSGPSQVPAREQYPAGAHGAGGFNFGDPALPARFWAKAHPSLYGCWLWIGSGTTNGYGQFQHDEKWQRAHRVAWEVLVGPIPDEFQLDHLCRVRSCVNPAHMEPVTQEENLRRQFANVELSTHCKRGHAFDEANTRISTRSDGRTRRVCRACAASRSLAQRRTGLSDL